MSRRHKAEKREVNPDPKYNDLIVSKFMNSIMKQGKKSVAERIVYGAMETVQAKAKSNPLQLFHQALERYFHGILDEWTLQLLDSKQAQLPTDQG